MKQYRYQELIEYTRMRKIPKGFEESYEQYKPDDTSYLMTHSFFEEMLAPYGLDEKQHTYLSEALIAVEEDERLLYFSKFFVWDMCSARNKYDVDNYSELVPDCIGKYNEAYCFLVLLACAEKARPEMERRGIPESYYKDIPHRMLREQMKRYKETGKIDVLDMPWKFNFYTLSIFLFDRFLFIPYVHGDRFTMYRSRVNGKVVGLYDGDCKFDTEGQLIDETLPEDDQEKYMGDLETCWSNPYIRNKDRKYAFITDFEDHKESVTGYYMNPLGFTENRKVTLDKKEFEKVLDKNDWLLAFHIPEGEGYTPSRVKKSMELALEFYGKYYPELPIKGFWSESWLYDSRLSLLLTSDKNIVKVQRQFFNYTGGWDGEASYYYLFGGIQNRLDEAECKSSLQKKAKEYLQKGNFFYSTGMIFLREEVDKITEYEGLTNVPYITEKDYDAFLKMLARNGTR